MFLPATPLVPLQVNVLSALQRRPTRLFPHAYRVGAVLLCLLLIPPPAGATSAGGDCTGWDVDSTHIDSPIPETGVLRLVCPSAHVECEEDVCRVGAGVISIVGASFCRRPIGPLSPSVAEPCGAVMDGLAAIIDATGCSTRTPVGDEYWEPGVFTRVRDDGTLIWSLTLSCGGQDATCTVRARPEDQYLRGCV